MHLIQKQILDNLRIDSELRYSELQPDDIESSHFKYHLNQLIKDGLVEHVKRGVYRLSSKGAKNVDLLSAGRIHPHSMPKVITYTLIQDEDNYYLHRKDKEPYRGLLNLVGGKVHSGETSLEAAKREVYEKTKLEISEPIPCGVVDIQIMKDEMLLSHVVAFVFVSNLPAILVDDVSLEIIPKNTVDGRDDLAPDLKQLLAAINGLASSFITEISISL